MAEPRLIEIKDLDPSEIDVTERLRPVTDAGVEALMASIQELGLVKDEVYVRKVKHQKGRLKLIAGGHRVEACRRLGRNVPAKIWDCTDDWATLMEIDDNLAGAELGALDTAVFLAARKRVYERLHPTSKHGGDRKGPAFKDQVDTMSVRFSKAVSDKFGLSDRHVRRLLSVGEAMSDLEIKALRELANAVTLSDLQALAKVADHDVRYDVILGMRSGTFKKAAEGVKYYKTGSNQKTPDLVNDSFKKMFELWKRAPKEAQRRFVEDRYAELGKLMVEIDRKKPNK